MIPIENKTLELLAPARNVLFGRAAINHGADAVYIGAPRFGARNSASNTIEDIQDLLKYAHLFDVKVYATLNTILFNDEIEEAANIIQQLYESGIDGIIIQDLGLLEMNLPPVPLIASTQTHNTTPEKVIFFEKLGFKRVILARELSLKEIQDIRLKTQIELESFIHGAICVSYSGRCYMSQAVCGRSGNRGVCAQPCRSSYDLVDRENNTLISNKYFLSQKDLNLANYLKDLVEAGVHSFKIEGRLKDMSYLKNVVSFYRKKLDIIMENCPEYQKSSEGKIIHHFNPEPERSFNRGFTDYFIKGRKQKTGEINTQKSVGKRIGYITAKGENWISLDNSILANGDGICFFDSSDTLHGTLVNKVIGNKVYLNDSTGAGIGIEVYRNHDHLFEKMLQTDMAERKISLKLTLFEIENGYRLEALSNKNIKTAINIECEKIEAKNATLAHKSINNQLSRLGDTVFDLEVLDINLTGNYFLPISLLNEMRRKVTSQLVSEILLHYQPEEKNINKTPVNYFGKQVDYSENIANDNARKFYINQGVADIEPALEISKDYHGKVVMTTKYCIRYQLNICPVYHKNFVQYKEPLFLRDHHHIFRLHFDCKNCVMQLILEK